MGVCSCFKEAWRARRPLNMYDIPGGVWKIVQHFSVYNTYYFKRCKYYAASFSRFLNIDCIYCPSIMLHHQFVEYDCTRSYTYLSEVTGWIYSNIATVLILVLFLALLWCTRIVFNFIDINVIFFCILSSITSDRSVWDERVFLGRLPTMGLPVGYPELGHPI